jgi:hypothetical protein
MKKILQLLAFTLILFFAQHTQAQDTIVHIPDANFKARLLAACTVPSTWCFGIAEDSLGKRIKIDINSDGEIQQSEAKRVYKLYMNYVQSSNDSSGAFNSLIGISAFVNLDYFMCTGHQFTSIDVSNNLKLKYLNCSNNKINNINLGNLYYLEILECNNNQITNLNLDSIRNLKFLYCYNNKISKLKILYNHYLEELLCKENKLIHIDFNKNVKRLECQNNEFVTLNLTNLTNLSSTIFNNCTNLQTVYMKNGVNSFQNQYVTYYYYDCPNLKYICADAEEIGALRQRANEYGYTNLTINSFCSSSSGGAFYTMKTNARYDANNNGCTAQDSLFPFLKYLIKNATDSGYAIADAQGNMSLDLNAGTYTIKPIFSHPYFTVLPTQANVTLPEDTLPTNFCITPIGNFNDVTIQIIPTNDARPGFSDATYQIIYTNKGTTTVSGTIRFTFQDYIQDFVSSSVVPASNANGVVTFSYSNLKPFESRSDIVTLRTNAPTDNPAVNGGDILELQAIATMNTTSNANSSDDTSTIRQTVVNSLDPNDKRCLEGDIVTPDLVGDFVNYLIRFENEGNANAINIVVTDRIDTTKFDITSLEVTASSHSNRTLITEGNKVQFIFDNINLPFTEPLKHGFIAFQIKTKNNLVIGDSLKNYADIFFDYNLPITTNTAGSRIDTFTRTGGITSIRSNTNKEGKLSIYPNPSNGNFRINFESKGSFPINIKLIDLNGRIIKSIEDEHQNQTSIDISESQLSNGLYQISIQTDKDIWQQKVMIVK